ncbi:MAG: STAS domain-containing protein [Spirochaetales bacterium]|nr:STAS domain-containing protein [Spirochaetales bacterium]
MIDIKVGSPKGESRKDRIRLTLSGRLTVNHALEMHGALSEALHETQHLEIKLKKVEETDLSFLQLLLSVRKSAQALGKEATVSGCAEESFQAAAADSGLFGREHGGVEGADILSWLEA